MSGSRAFFTRRFRLVCLEAQWVQPVFTCENESISLPDNPGFRFVKRECGATTATSITLQYWKDKDWSKLAVFEMNEPRYLRARTGNLFSKILYVRMCFTWTQTGWKLRLAQNRKKYLVSYISFLYLYPSCLQTKRKIATHISHKK